MLLINNRMQQQDGNEQNSRSIVWSNTITSTKHHAVATESFQILRTHQPALLSEQPECERALWSHVSVPTSLHGQNRPT